MTDFKEIGEAQKVRRATSEVTSLELLQELSRRIGDSEAPKDPTPQDAEREYWESVDPETVDLRNPELNMRLRLLVYGRHHHEWLPIIESPAALWKLQEVMLTKNDGERPFLFVAHYEREGRLERLVRGYQQLHDATNAETLVRAAVSYLKAEALKDDKPLTLAPLEDWQKRPRGE